MNLFKKKYPKFKVCDTVKYVGTNPFFSVNQYRQVSSYERVYTIKESCGWDALNKHFYYILEGHPHAMFNEGELQYWDEFKHLIQEAINRA